MLKQLYRFQLHRETSRGVWAGVDEHDDANVWFVQVALDPHRREGQLAALKQLPDARGYEDFSADENFYIVVPSEQKASELVAALTAARLLTPEKKQLPETGQTPPPPPPPPWRWIVSFAVLAFVAFLAGKSLGWWNSAAAAPVLSPAPGGLASAPVVALSDATAGAVIHYTIDGSQPTESSPVYSEPLKGLRNGVVVRAIAIAPGFPASAEVSGEYQWTAPPAPSPGDSPSPAYLQGKNAYDRENWKVARQAFEQACNQGEVPACNYFAFLYAKGLGGPRDVRRAGEIYAGACDKGNMASCSSLGSLYENSGQNAEARICFKKACDGHFAKACSLLDDLRKNTTPP